jgi:hypothetical protein
MNWPEKPTCHESDPRFLNDEIIWRALETVLQRGIDGYPMDQPFRSCSYCGSIHPEDLLKVIEQGATLGGADWKYGWPHKFYIDRIPSGLPFGVDVKVGGESGWEVVDGKRVRFDKSIMGKTGQFTHAKWYNEHLYDLNTEEFAEAFKAVTDAILTHGHIAFTIDDGKLRYSAPSRGYQKV